MPPQPNTSNEWRKHKRGYQETRYVCSCGQWRTRWRKLLGRVPNIAFTPFHCPKCNKQVSDFTMF